MNSTIKCMLCNIHKTIIINYNAPRMPYFTKGGYKLSTCVKY